MGVNVAVTVSVAVTVGVGGSVPDGVTVAVGVTVGGTVSVALGVGVGVWLGVGVAEKVGVGPPGPGAPPRIHARTFSMSAAESGGIPSGMRLPSPGAGLVSLINRKLMSALPGTTRSRPIARATSLKGTTPTRFPYETSSSRTRLPCCEVELWQGAETQLTLKMVRWISS